MRVFTHNSAGRRDNMLLMSWLTLLTILGKVTLAGVSVVVGGQVVNLGAGMDSGMAGVLLTATLGAYVARRNAWGVSRVGAQVAQEEGAK